MEKNHRKFPKNDVKKITNFFLKITEKFHKPLRKNSVKVTFSVTLFFTENVNFTEKYGVTRLPKNFCKNHRTFLTV